jgi:hypothetical protein
MGLVLPFPIIASRQSSYYQFCGETPALGVYKEDPNHISLLTFGSLVVLELCACVCFELYFTLILYFIFARIYIALATIIS